MLTRLCSVFRFGCVHSFWIRGCSQRFVGLTTSLRTVYISVLIWLGDFWFRKFRIATWYTRLLSVFRFCRRWIWFRLHSVVIGLVCRFPL